MTVSESWQQGNIMKIATRYPTSSSCLVKLSLMMLAACCTAHAADDAVTSALKSEPGASGTFSGTTLYIDMRMDANAAMHQSWPSGGVTWHYGVGSIDPFGAASYWCGKDFPEEKEHPLPKWLNEMMLSFTGKGDPLFCVYRVKDGDFYVYDSVAGSRAMFNDGAQNQSINIVIDGTGPFKGATGIWLGITEGHGLITQVSPGRRVPQMLLKIMDGYVKLPAVKP
jgi:hypothetical protein